MSRPLLFLDVDGPLIPFGGSHREYPIPADLGGVDRAWVSVHHPGPALLHAVDSRVGLTGGDLDRIAAWLSAN